MLPIPAVNAVGGLIGAIVAAALALSIWEIGTRSIRQLVGDVVDGAHRGPSLLRGILRAIVGAVFAVLALAIVLRTLPDAMLPAFPFFAIGTFLAALVVEALLGDVVRRAMGIRHARGLEERSR